MTRAFEKIAARLADAIAHAGGDATRGRVAMAQAEDTADIAAADRALAESDVRYSRDEVDRMFAGEMPFPE